MSNLLLFPPTEHHRPPQPPDAAVRAEALDIRRSFIVQAPAGSGKTALLIQRFLKLLADESVLQPEQVLAITFTNAATAELRGRVLAQLEIADAEIGKNPTLDLAAGGEGDFARLTLDLAHQVLARDAALDWHLLMRPHRLNIRTIDSLCAEVARTLPVLSDSGGANVPTEDAGALYREAARRTLLLLGSEDAALNAALRDVLLHRDGNLSDCEALLADMLALRDQWGMLVPLDRRELDEAWLDGHLLPRLERTLESAIDAVLSRLHSLFPAHLLKQLASMAGEFAHLAGAHGGPSPVACCAGWSDTPQPQAADLIRWRAILHLLVTADCRWRKRINAADMKFELHKSHPRRAELQSVLDQLRDRDDLLATLEEVRHLPAAQYPADQWSVAKSLFRVLNRALVELQLVFAARGRCDFTELALLARGALQTGPGTADFFSALGARLQHLLVDEMQDTSTIQYELIELLTASWDGHSQTVFLVGDPCQSVYLFRQARVERFIHTLETGRLGGILLTRLSLSANFRSQAKLVEEFNRDFGLVFSGAQTAGSHPGPRCVAADAVRPRSSFSEAGVWHINPQVGPSASSEGALEEQWKLQARRDADLIATIAADWLARPLHEGHDVQWRIAVLVRSRNHLAEIVPALRRADVSFRALDIETLQDRQEVLDLAALTRVLLHPADRVAGLAVLRAPWCGLPLADLHTLAGADDFSFHEHSVPRLIDERGHLLSTDSKQRLARVQDVLRGAARLRARLSMAQLVERAWRTLGGDAPLTSAQLTNARRFFELLDRLEAEDRTIDSSKLEGHLARLYAEPDPVPENSGYVELLTIHKAKGLEWDVVFIPALERRPAAAPSRLLTWAALDELDGPNIMLAPIAARGEEIDALTSWLKRRHRALEYAENKRLFYVASTRAREELHIFAAPVMTPNGVSRGHPDTLLRAAWPAIEHQFVNTHAKTSAHSECSISEMSQPLDIGLPARAFPPLHRLPATFDPAARFTNAGPRRLRRSDGPTTRHESSLPRPEGSFAARALGNAIHMCVERLATKMAHGETCDSLLAELPSWSTRIHALLRAAGLSAESVTRLALEARIALQNLLRDPDGRWLIDAHKGGATEISMTAASDDDLSSVRADRTFLAGPEPHAAGESNLWIVDYKTASTSGAGQSRFMADQRAAYGPQLATYAHILAPVHSVAIEQVRLALYFPMLAAAPRLLWWKPGLELVSGPDTN